MLVADVMNASRARKASSRVKARSSTLMPSAFATSITVARVTPGRISQSERARHEHAFGCHNPGIAGGTLCNSAGSIHKPSFARICMAGRVLCQDRRQQHNGFDVPPAPAIVRHRFDGNARFSQLVGAFTRSGRGRKQRASAKRPDPAKQTLEGPLRASPAYRRCRHGRDFAE